MLAPDMATRHSAHLPHPSSGRSVNLVYLADTQIPSRATNGIQVMRMCAAFAANGANVTLVHPHRFGNRPEGFDGDVCSFYGVDDMFRRVRLPTPLTLRLSGFRLPRQSRRERSHLRSWLVARCRPGAAPFAVYSRSMAGAWLALRISRSWGRRSACRRVFIELHDMPETDLARKVLVGCRRDRGHQRCAASRPGWGEHRHG